MAKNQGGSMLFTAADFENEPGTQDEQQEAEQTREPSKPIKNPLDDIELDIVEDESDEQSDNEHLVERTTTDTSNEPRYPDDDSVPEALRGKTLKEGAQLFSTMAQLTNTALARAEQAAAAAQQRTGQPTQQQDEAEIQFGEEDFGLGADPQKFQQKLYAIMDGFAQKKMQPFQTSQLIRDSQFAHQKAERDLPHWDLFGQQILAEALQLPINYTASYDTWKIIHDRHVAANVEKVAEKLATKAAPPKPEPSFSERSSGASVSGGEQSRGGGKKKYTITKSQASVARALGLNPRQIVPYIG